MFATENLAHAADEGAAAAARWRARTNAVTVDLCPPPGRVITQKIRTIAAEPWGLAEREASPLKRRKFLGVGSVLRQRYVIESRLGCGGMGTVFKAADVFRRAHAGIDPYVAIKVLHERTFNCPEALDKLRREFYCAQALSHRNIIKVYDLDRDGSLDFFTMEWLDGEVLSSVLKRFHPRPLPRAAAWAILREIGAGLVHAHERDVVHADLKPQNIMITKHGEVRILDFGASSGSTRDQLNVQRSQSMAVTPAYASCELLAGQAADPRDDVFALACLGYELLAGAHPFGYRRATEARDANMIPKRPPQVSARQWRALKQGLAWDRKDRSISVRDWLKLLRPGEGELHAIPIPRLTAAPAPAPAPAPASARAVAVAVVAGPQRRAAPLARRTTLGLTVGLGMLLVLLLAWAGLRRPPPARPAALQIPVGYVQEPMPSAADAAEPPVSGPEEALAASSPKAHRTARRESAPRTPTLAIAARAYRIAPGVHFAEIRVHRTVASPSRTGFEWRTEDGTGLAGFDYVGQADGTAFFPPGSLNSSLFVKVLANDARRRPATFFVSIASPSDGAAVKRSRVPVILLPKPP